MFSPALSCFSQNLQNTNIRRILALCFAWNSLKVFKGQDSYLPAFTIFHKHAEKVFSLYPGCDKTASVFNVYVALTVEAYIRHYWALLVILVLVVIPFYSTCGGSKRRLSKRQFSLRCLLVRFSASDIQFLQ